MNKKFFGFLIVVAALFSVCTLESCKDTNSDLWNEVVLKQNTQYQDLLNRIEAIKQCPVDCETVEKNVKSLMDEQAKIKAAIEALQAKDGDFKALIEALQAKNGDFQNQIDSLKANDGNLQDQIDALKAGDKNLQNLIDSLLAQNADFMILIESLQAKGESLQSQIDSLLAKDSDFISQYEELLANDADLQEQIDALKKIDANLQEQIDALTIIDANLQSQIDNINLDIEKLGLKDDSLQYQITDLEKKIKDLENNNNTHVVGVDLSGIYSRLSTIEKKLELLDKINTHIETLDQQIDVLSNSVKTLKADVKVLEDRVTKLEARATDITVQAVWNPIFGYFNTPFGLSSNLAVAYVPSFFGGYMRQAKIPDTFFEEVSAGKIYLTVNPVSNDFAGSKVELVTTSGKAADGFSLTELAKSNEELQFGVGTRANQNQYLYETKVEADIDAVNTISLDTEGAVEALKRVVDNNRINFTELANVVVETLKKARLDAYMVSLEQGDATIASKADIAAVAVEPLNFVHIKALESAASSAADKLTAKLEALETKINGAININVPSGTVDVDIPVQSITVPKLVENPDGSYTTEDDTVSVGGGTTQVQIPTITGLENLSQISDLVSKMVDVATAGLDKVERLAAIANPVIFVMDESGKFCALSTNPDKPTVVNSADVVLYPTSYCLETIVPYFAKYVKVGKNEAKVLPNTQKSLPISLGSGVNEITYAACDYSDGRSPYRTYYVKVAQ